MKIFLGPEPPTTVEDIRGKKFNRWRCIGYSHKDGVRHFWYFRCKCGTEEVKHAGHIVGGRSTSCGCSHSKNLANRNRTHGLTKNKLYVIWKAIHQRCENTNHAQYGDYGGRGIRVCKRWSGTNGAKNFINDMGERPKGCSVERRNNDKGYSPENCYWATKIEQARNKRNNLLITAFGRTQCLAAWSDEIEAKPGALYYRIVTAKWPTEKALTEPFK